jgi:hypothetical protein
VQVGLREAYVTIHVLLSAARFNVEAVEEVDELEDVVVAEELGKS